MIFPPWWSFDFVFDGMELYGAIDGIGDSGKSPLSEDTREMDGNDHPRTVRQTRGYSQTPEAAN
jgi:hypothetical protein